MGIFSLNQKQEEMEKKVEEENTTKSKDEIQKEIQSGEVPISSIPKSEEKKEEKPVEIVLAGPLGHIYTQALNVLLAKEDSTSMFKIYDEYEKEEVEDDDEYDDTKSFVYVADASKLQQPEVVDAYNQIVKFKDTYPAAAIVVGLESNNGFTKAANVFDRCMTDLGIKTYYKRKTISDAIANLYTK